MTIHDVLAMLRAQRQSKVDATGMVEALAELMTRNYDKLSAGDSLTLGRIGAVLAQHEVEDAWNAVGVSRDVSPPRFKQGADRNAIVLTMPITAKVPVRRMLSEQAMQSAIKVRQDSHPECETYRFAPVVRQAPDAEGCNWAVPTPYAMTGLNGPACCMLSMANDFRILRAKFNLEPL